jgi:nucleoside-triphosphatase THEP1
MRKSLEGKLWIISGEIGAGKTILCGALIDAFRTLDWNVTGLRSPAIMQAGVKTGIAVENLRTGELRQLAVSDYKPDGLDDDPIHWTFDPDVMDWSNQVFLDAVPTDLFVVDELGPLEMKKEMGWQKALQALDSRWYRQAILIMRPKLLELAKQRWPWGETVVIEHVDQVKVISEQLMLKWQ